MRPHPLAEPNNEHSCPKCASSPTNTIFHLLSTAVTQMTTDPLWLWKIVCPSSVSIYTHYHPVYLHCYNQGLSTFCWWLQIFPEVVLGISPLALTDHCHPSLQEVIVNLHNTKLLLETDSPYLPGPDALGYKGVGSPTLIYHLAQQVSQWWETATVWGGPARSTAGNPVLLLPINSPCPLYIV